MPSRGGVGGAKSRKDQREDHDGSTVSANWQVHDPDQDTVVSEDWYLRENPLYWHGPTVPESQAQGLKVTPYTINDEATMQRAIDSASTGSSATTTSS